MRLPQSAYDRSKALIVGATFLTAGGCATAQQAMNEASAALSVVAASPASDEDSVTSVAVGKPITGAINFAGDVDRYEVELQPGEEVVVFGRSAQEDGGTVEIRLLDPARRELGTVGGHRARYHTNLQAQTTERLRIQEDGSYVIEVEEPLHGRTPSYEFQIHVVDTEPEDTDRAAAVALGVPVQGRIDHPYDIDRYEVELQSGQEVIVFGRSAQERATVEIRLLDPARRVVGSVGGHRVRYHTNLQAQTTERLRIREGGSYVIEVEELLRGGTPTYEFQIQVVQ